MTKIFIFTIISYYLSGRGYDLHMTASGIIKTDLKVYYKGWYRSGPK